MWILRRDTKDIIKQGYVYVNGKKANILGKICMDQCIVDLTDIKDVSMDSEVIFYWKWWA